MGQSQLLIIMLSVLIIGIAILAGAGFFSDDNVDANKKAMINDFHHIAVNAVRYYRRIPALGGGGYKYDGYVLPVGYRANLNGRYSVVVKNSKTLEIDGVSALDSTDTMVTDIDENGRAANWTFAGDFQ
jgi:hypothetical protein